jgi:hypothetical protein
MENPLTTRNRLLEAAISIIETQGEGAIRVDQVAELAGLRLASIGVRLSTARTSRGSSTSTTGPSTAAIRRTLPTCVRCGLFNYLPIHLFVFRAPSARRTQEKYF